ncbi:hypothetical protein AVEN_64993-1 [Araneus ventricosus]|uniref:Uncharacterized protein n=1 Tax=Araneus ventricosus TaxID=182803 RepID=A0A4Y2LUH2_ARAVE|nr:hypothetical protein AVEN_64993-1 [Araneus ventricosus]
MFRILCVALNVKDLDIHRVLAKVLAVVRNVRVMIMILQFVYPILSNVLTALVQSLKVKRNISSAEVKKLVLDRTPKAGISYSAAMRPTLKSTGAQTEILDIISLNTESSPPIHPKTSYNKLALESDNKSKQTQKQTKKNEIEAAASSNKILQYISTSQSEFTSAHLPKKKLRRAKTLPNVNVPIPGSPPEPPKTPDPSDNTALSDAVLKICPSASDLSDVDMDQRPSNPPSPGDHV